MLLQYTSDDQIKAGYRAVYQAEAEDIIPGRVGAVEILMANTGSGNGQQNTIAIQVAVQRPLSQGYVKLISASPFDQPSIDPSYLAHPADLQLYIAAYKWARQLAATPPLSTILTGEITPGAAVSTDAEWATYLRQSSSTEYHPAGERSSSDPYCSAQLIPDAGSCSMLPRELGGVVNSKLQVFGTSNVRVVDASIVPIGLSAHLMAPTYGIAEKGAALINAARTGNNAGSSSASSSQPRPTATVSGPAAAATSNPPKSAAGGIVASVGLTAICALFAAVAV